MLQLTPIKDIPETLQVRDTKIIIYGTLYDELTKVMNFHETYRRKDTLISPWHVQRTFQDFYQTIADIMTKKIDLEPYLPWRKGSLNGTLPTDREILIKSSYLCAYVDEHVKGRYAYQLRLVPEIDCYKINRSEFTGKWILSVGMFVEDISCPPIINKDKMHKSHILRGNAIPIKNLEHGGVYLDNHGQEWITLRNIHIAVDTDSIRPDPKNPGKTIRKPRNYPECRRWNLLHVKLDRIAHSSMHANPIHDSASVLMAIAPHIMTPYMNMIDCLVLDDIPNLIRKTGSVPVYEDTEKYSSAFDCTYDRPGESIVHMYNITYTPEENSYA